MIFALIGTVVAATAAPTVTVLPAGALHCSTVADGTACRGIPYAAPRSARSGSSRPHRRSGGAASAMPRGSAAPVCRR
jgi:hypothetical protein